MKTEHQKQEYAFQKAPRSARSLPHGIGGTAIRPPSSCARCLFPSQAELLAPASSATAPSPECIIKGNVTRQGEAHLSHAQASRLCKCQHERSSEAVVLFGRRSACCRVASSKAVTDPSIAGRGEVNETSRIEELVLARRHTYRS
jgi:hypothetical protein